MEVEYFDVMGGRENKTLKKIKINKNVEQMWQ
jgi:hypothetical protein